MYLAHDRELDEDVAIKVLPPLHTADETAVKRFINEIRLARRISHRNVVRTHDVGRWTGGLFLTMEYVAGRTVRELLDADGPFAPSRAIALAIELLDALVVAHAAGVIHRDLKPQNLLLDAQGSLKVLDFGIAIVQGTSGQLTEAGLVVGTPAYMAPEQLMGETITPASDLYAVGVLLYELLAGTLPYTAQSPLSLVAQIISTKPAPLTRSVPDIDPRLADLVMRLLTYEEADRPRSAIEVLGELRGLASL